MTKLLEEAVAELRTLPEDEQDCAAQALLAFARERADYSFDHDQIAGIHHAMGQADRGEFASDAVVRDIGEASSRILGDRCITYIGGVGARRVRS